MIKIFVNIGRKWHRILFLPQIAWQYSSSSFTVWQFSTYFSNLFISLRGIPALMATKCAVYAYHVNLSLELPYNREKKVNRSKEELEAKTPNKNIRSYVCWIVHLCLCLAIHWVCTGVFRISIFLHVSVIHKASCSCIMYNAAHKLGFYLHQDRAAE